jgi:hypothetical protein
MTPRTIVKEGLRLSRMTKTGRIGELIVSVVLFICSWFVISVVPFLQRNFGERYLSWINLYFGYTAVATFMFGGAFIPGSPDGYVVPFLPFPVSIPMLLCYLAFIVLSLAHRLLIWKRNHVGEEWHSFSQGESWLGDILANRDKDGRIRSRPSEELIHRWGEPILVTLGAC